MADSQIEGLDGVLKKMRTLGPKLQKRGLQAAVRKGANVVKKAAIVNAKRIDDKETSEAIYRNIAVKTNAKAGRKIGGIVLSVGVLGGAKQYAKTKANARSRRSGKTYKTGGSKANPGGDTWYWRFIEFGFTHKGGTHVGARPFLRPAIANNVDKATEVIVTELNKQIDKLIAKG